MIDHKQKPSRDSDSIIHLLRDISNTKVKKIIVNAILLVSTVKNLSSEMIRSLNYVLLYKFKIPNFYRNSKSLRLSLTFRKCKYFKLPLEAFRKHLRPRICFRLRGFGVCHLKYGQEIAKGEIIISLLFRSFINGLVLCSANFLTNGKQKYKIL